MVDAGKARVGLFVRLMLSAMLAAACAAGAAHADDKTSQATAPIEYRKPAVNARAVRLENAAPAAALPEIRNAAVTQTPLTFDQFQGRTPVPAGATDLLRPVETVSFGVPLPAASLAPRTNEVRGLTSAPVAAPAVRAMTQPLAGPAYQVAGRWYVPMHEPNYDETGVASWYGPNFHGKASATGEEYDQYAMTAAHPTLPIPSLVRVTNTENGRTVVVRLNDRGPFVDDRIIDLSRAAAEELDVVRKGTAKVRVQYIGPAPAEANAIPQAIAYEPETLPAKPAAMAPAVVLSVPTPASPSFGVAAAAPAMTVKGQGAAPAVETGKGFFLQTGSFAEAGNAEKMRAQLADFWPAAVEPVKVGKADYYRVMLGPWTDRQDAEMAQQRLAQTGAKAIVVARD